MSEFVLVWVLVSAYYGLQYSPPMKTLEDCQRVQEMASKYSSSRTQCIQINILRRGDK